MNEKRLQEIKDYWLGKDGKGLAITGNASYKMIAELIAEIDRLNETIVNEKK